MARTRPRRAWSLLELLLVLIILGVLLGMATPSFKRSLEQARADAAAANLRAIWAAERLYWLEHHQYTSSFTDLASLLDPGVASGNAFYLYAIPSAGANSFQAVATRRGSTQWTGQLSINETGAMAGSIQAAGHPAIVPGFP